MVGVDLFAGAGGLSAGAVAAGVQIAKALEIDRYAAETYRTNHPDVELILDDIRYLPDLSPIRSTQKTVLFGGPPCQGFSTSNQRTRGFENPSNHLYTHFLRHLRSMRPTFFVFENVKGFIDTNCGYFFSSIVNEFRQLGYRVTHGILNAMDFGIPQRRSRLFIVGSLIHTPSLPPASTVEPTLVSDALFDLPVLPNGAKFDEAAYRTDPQSTYAQRLRADNRLCMNNLVTRNSDYVVKRYAYIPPGGNWRNIPSRLMGNYADCTRCHDGIYHRLSWDKPSIVIGNYRKNMLIHPSSDRGLSVREAARLQSFADSYIFCGGIGFQQQQVANAVPPILAQAVFESLVQQSQ